jgi:hypothetical protein
MSSDSAESLPDVAQSLHESNVVLSNLGRDLNRLQSDGLPENSHVRERHSFHSPGESKTTPINSTSHALSGEGKKPQPNGVESLGESEIRWILFD